MELNNNMQKGFTLLELLVVVLVIGILAAVAVPQYQVAVLKSRYATLKTLTNSLADAEELYYLTNGDYTGDFNALDIDIPTPLECQGSVTTSRTCFFPNQKCSLNPFSRTVLCTLMQNNAAILGYNIRLHHSTWATQKRACYNFTAIANSPADKVCQSETARTTPTATTSEQIQWNYPEPL